MSEIEKAMQEIEDMAYHPSMKTDITGESMATILQALQEKAEREDGCEYCKEFKNLVSLGTEHRLEIGEDGIAIWKGVNLVDVFNINFCPMCGRKLVEE